MPAAPAGRALPPARGGADRPCAQSRHPPWLHAGLGRPARQPAPCPAARRRRAGAAGHERARTTRAYWAFADRLQDHLDAALGGDGMYRPERSMLQRDDAPDPRRGGAGGAHRPGAPGRAGAQAHRPRCARAGLAKRPADGPQGHVPGWTDSLGGQRIQHLVVDTEIAWALAVRVARAGGARRSTRPPT